MGVSSGLSVLVEGKRGGELSVCLNRRGSAEGPRLGLGSAALPMPQALGGHVCGEWGM